MFNFFLYATFTNLSPIQEINAGNLSIFFKGNSPSQMLTSSNYCSVSFHIAQIIVSFAYFLVAKLYTLQDGCLMMRRKSMYAKWIFLSDLLKQMFSLVLSKICKNIIVELADFLCRSFSEASGLSLGSEICSVTRWF